MTMFNKLKEFFPPQKRPSRGQKKLRKYSRKSIPFRKILERLDWVTPEIGPPVRIGLDIGATSIRTVTMEHINGKARLIDLRFLPCSTEPISNLTQELKRIFTEKFEDNVEIHATVSGASTLVRYITMPQMSEKEFRQSMSYEAEKYIPYQISDVVVDSYLIGEDLDERGKKIIKGILAVCKRDAIKTVLQSCRDVEAPLTLVDAPPLAVINAFQFNYPDSLKETVGLLHIGQSACNLSILLKGEPVFTREISFGGADFTQAIVKGLSITTDQAEKRKLAFVWKNDTDIRPLIVEALGFLAQEIRLSFNYFENHVTKAEPPSKLYISGSSTQLDHFQELLAEQTGIPVSDWDPLAKIEVGHHIEASRVTRLKPGLAVCAGLALR
ncbi:MAG: pilus assembly protein PilM [Candidatus Omnitrophica bacterium]|nr:pilus assembly protein PilM [Candidatus Omnitrophota bacterium]